MGMIDHMLNGARDPKVREYHQRQAAIDNFFASYRRYNMWKEEPLSLRDHAIKQNYWPAELGPLPETEADCEKALLR